MRCLDHDEYRNLRGQQPEPFRDKAMPYWVGVQAGRCPPGRSTHPRDAGSTLVLSRVQNVLQELRDALIALNVERIKSTIAKIAALDAALGAILHRSASQYAYTAIFDAIEAQNQRPPG